MRDEQIPFGKDATSGEIRHISDVVRGNACSCICPACNHPLTAKKGSTNRHHFAHQTRNIFNSEKELCEYSFYASVRAIALQSFVLSVDVHLPDYFVIIPDSTDIGRTCSIQVTESRTVRADSYELVKNRTSSEGHLKLFVSIYTIHVLITHPGGPKFDSAAIENNAGYLEIDLEALKYDYLDDHLSEFDAKYVCESIWGDLCPKRWIFHPRELRLIEKYANNIVQSRSDFGKNKKVDDYLRKK